MHPSDIPDVEPDVRERLHSLRVHCRVRQALEQVEELGEEGRLVTSSRVGPTREHVHDQLQVLIKDLVKVQLL